MPQFRGADFFVLGSVLTYVVSVFDGVTDILFAFLMHLKCEMQLFYISFLFTLLPFILSIMFSIYWIIKWNDRNVVTASFRITRYLKEYSVILVIFAACGDFYSAISFVRSKMFCLNALNFGLKKSEMEQLVVYKFVNVSLCEVCCMFPNCCNCMFCRCVVFFCFSHFILSMFFSFCFLVN